MKVLIHYFLALIFICIPFINFSQLIGTSAYIIGDNVEIGINDAGHEGAPLLATSNNRSNQAVTSPVYFGFVANPQLDGWVNYDGDFFTPGSPENGFGLEIDGVNYNNNASGSLEQIEGSISSYEEDGDCISVTWEGSEGDIDMTIVYKLVTTELYYTTQVTLTNNGATDYYDVFYHRNLDPDNNVTVAGGSYVTQNTVVAQPEPGCEKALVSATQTTPWDSYIGLGAIGENFRVTYGGFANRDASDIWDGVGGLIGTVGSTAFVDQAISLAYKCDTLEVDEAETFTFTVILAEDQIDAAISSLYFFDYDGGDGIIDECSFEVDTAETCDGQPVTLSVEGPNSEDYTWVWSPGTGLSTTDGPVTDASPAVTTTYTVTGTPDLACLSSSIEKTIVVEIVASPIIDIVDPGPQCESFDLTTLVVNDLGGITDPIIEFYSVIPDSVDQTTGIWPADVMFPGDVVYVMLGDTALRCFDVELVDITFVTPPNSGDDAVETLCNAAGTTIDMDDYLSGADAGGTWSETTGSGSFDVGTAVFDASGLPAGDYTFIYVTTNVPCNNDTADFTVTVNPIPTVTATATPIEICIGESVTFTGGGADTYVWTGGVTDGVPFTPLTAGTFTFDVTGTITATTCENTASIDIEVHDLPTVTATATPTEVCDGESVTLTGGGAATYGWDGGATDGLAFTPPLGTTTYTVTGVDALGCQNTVTVDVTVNPLPVIVPSASATEVCTGDEVTLSGIGADTYVWDGGVTDGVPFTPPLGTTTYTVTGTDANGCESSATIDISVVDLPAVTASVTETEICIGEDVVFFGGGADTYVWTGGVTDGVPFTPVVTGTFTFDVTGTLASGCENTATIDITVHDLPTVTATAAPDEVCDGEEVTLTGGGADTYVWDGGATDGVAFAPPVGTTTYTVTGTDVNGCESTATVDVTVNPLPVVDIDATATVVCLGDEVTLSGTGADTYAWDGGITDGTAFVVPAGTTTYTVTGTDTEGCVSTAIIDITSTDLPDVSAVASPTEICIGESITLSGVGADTYVWSGGVEDGVAFTPVAVGTFTYDVIGTLASGCNNTAAIDIIVHDLPTVTATAAPMEICDGETLTLMGGGADTYVWDGSATDGVAFAPPVGTTTYTVIGTDANGCENTATVDVSVNPLPTVTASASELEICLGESITFTGGGAATYTWDGGVTDGTPFTPTSAGTFTFTVTGTSAAGCSSTATISVEVTECEEVAADFAFDDNICVGDCIEIADQSIGTIVSWEWSFDGGIPETSTDQNPIVCFNTPGVYTIDLTVINIFGIESSATDIIIVNETPIMNTREDTIIDIGGTAIISAHTASDGIYIWTPDEEMNCSDCSITEVRPQDNTTYTVLFVDENGCSTQDTVMVLVNFIRGVGVPSAFSPNGDGENDVLYVKGYGLEAISFRVFNRYGEMVFETSDQRIGWDGTFKNRMENPGVFTWTLHYNFVDGKRGMQKGNTTLIR